MTGPKGVEQRILGIGPDLVHRGEEAPIIVRAENPNRFLEIEKMPLLVPGEWRIRTNRVTGAIHLRSFRIKAGNEERVTFEEGIIYQRGKKTKGAAEVAIRWSEYPDIETTIRTTDHILEKHEKDGGQTVENTKRVARLVSEFLGRFKTSRVAKDDLEGLASQAFSVLEEAGFITARKPIKQKTAMQLRLATGLDSKGRLNPLISRTRLASAWLKIIQELLFAKNVREKYSSLRLTLSNERDFERLCLEQAKMILSGIMNLPSDSREIERGINLLKGFATRYLLPETIKAAPYRRPAVLALATLFGVKKERNKKLIRAMLEADPEKAEELINNQGIDKVIKGPDRTVATSLVKEKMVQALEFLDQTLAPREQDLIT